MGGHWSPDSCACRRRLHGWWSVECVPSSPSAPRASCDTMQDSGRAPGAPSGYSRCALRPRRRPSTEHSPESQKQPAASQSGFISACAPAPESPIRLPSPPRGRGRLLLGKMVKARGLITSIPGAKRAGKHGTAGFGSSAPADALRQFGRQPLRAPLLKPNDWPLPPSHPPDRPKEGHGRKGGFDLVVRAGDGIHHVKCFPLDSVAAGHPNTVSRSGISERSGCYPHAIVATRDWLILTESLHVSRSRAESSPCPRRKGATQSSTCCWTPHESQSRHGWFDRHCRLKLPGRARGYQISFSPSPTIRLCLCRPLVAVS